MVSKEAYRQMALALPGSEEKPHFDIPSFRVKNKIFTTLHEKTNRAMIKLSIIDQSVFCAIDSSIIYPVPGGWGKAGATFFELKKVKKDILKDALLQSWMGIAPKQEVLKYKGEKG